MIQKSSQPKFVTYLDEKHSLYKTRKNMSKTVMEGEEKDEENKSQYGQNSEMGLSYEHSASMAYSNSKSFHAMSKSLLINAYSRNSSNFSIHNNTRHPEKSSEAI